MALVDIRWENDQERETVERIMLDWTLYGEIHVTNAPKGNGLTRLDPRLVHYEPAVVVGRCGCTIHEDHGKPCGYTGPSSDYRDPLSQVCDTCMRVCWGVES